MNITRRSLLAYTLAPLVASAAKLSNLDKTEYGLVGFHVNDRPCAHFLELQKRPKYDNIPEFFPCILTDKNQQRQYKGGFARKTFDSVTTPYSFYACAWIAGLKYSSGKTKVLYLWPSDERLDAYLPISFCNKHKIPYNKNIKTIWI